MARYSNRLSHFSSQGRPKLDISRQEFEALEAVYGTTLSKPVRAELKEICDTYLFWRQPEIMGGTYADVANLFAEVKAAVQAFTPFAFGSLTPVGPETENSDAGTELQALLSRHMRDLPIFVPRRQLLDEAGNLPNEDEKIDGYQGIALSMDTLRAIGEALQASINRADREIGKRAKSRATGFVPGQAFRAWILQMRCWADAHGTTLSAYIGMDKKRPSRFARFLFELNNLFPEEYREEVSSPEAMASRIKRATREKGSK